MLIELTQAKAHTTDPAIENTKLLIASLKKKMREHNASNANKITYSQLKAVFIAGAQSKGDVSTIERGFARVNMFLRLSVCEQIAHEFRISTIKAGNSTLLDFSNYIAPSEQDFKAATEDIKKHKIEFTIASIDDLYFDDYEYFPLTSYL
jgi:hypothetical protein